MQHTKTNLLLLCICLAMFSGLSVDILVPALPTFARFFHASQSHAQLVVSIFFLGYAIAQLFCGFLSDWKGRKRILLIGLTLYLVGTIVCLVSKNLDELLLFRLLQAAGACSAIVSSFALARNRFQDSGYMKAITYITVGISLFPILFSILGGCLDHYFGWRAAFIFSAFACVLMMIWCYLALPSDRASQTSETLTGLITSYRKMLANKSYWGYLLCSTTIFIVSLSFITAVPFLYKAAGAHSSSTLGYLLAANSGFLVIGSWSVRLFEDRHGIDIVIKAGSYIMIASGILLLILMHSNLLSKGFAHFIPMYLMSIGVGLIMPTSQSGLLKDYKEAAGQANALAGFVRFFAASIASNLVLHADNVTLVLGVLIVIMGVVNFLLLRHV